MPFWNGKGQRFEWLHCKSDGALFDAEVSLNTIKFKDQILLLAMVRDITERKRIENELKENKERLQYFVDSLTDWIYSVKLNGDTILNVSNSEGSLALTGYTPLELQAFPNMGDKFVYKEDRSTFVQYMKTIFAGGKALPMEHRLCHRDGTIKWVRNISLPQFDELGHVVRVDGLITDITDRKLAEESLITSLRKEEQRVMEAVIHSEENERSRIAQDLHDGLGPVLSTIKLYFQVYKDTKDESKKTILAEKLTGTIQEAIREVSEISHNISPHVFRNYGFYAALRQFVHRIALTNVITIDLDCTTEPGLTQNAGIMLYRAVCELISNSLKHASCNIISVVIRKEGDFVITDYSDDGKGFDVSAGAGTKGKGSGLVNIMNRLNALKGSAELTSKNGEGMQACLKIPV